MKNQHIDVVVVGAGLAGCEIAFSLAEKGHQVLLLESKRIQRNPSQKLTTFAELVCTNSLKSNEPTSAHGVLKYEMEGLGSIILKIARKHSVPAGDALAVNRETFSQELTEVMSAHPNIHVLDVEVSDPIEWLKRTEAKNVVMSTGPLTTPVLEKWLQGHLGKEDLYFYDAIAPVVDADSLDLNVLFFQNRHDETSISAQEATQYIEKLEEEEKYEEAKNYWNSLGDYLNIPLDKEQYETFIAELVKSEKVPAKNFEDYRFFESCLPVDLMAERGPETARFSCMKPIGLKRPDGTRPYAAVQLRKESLLGSAYNLVGFQTRLTYKEQVRVFRTLPGLEKANFIHLGSVHRNTFLNAPKVLSWDFSSLKFPQLFFAGQITGVEGYTESAAMGLMVAEQIAKRLKENTPAKSSPLVFPKETAIGALVNYVMTATKPTPSNINFGLLPEVERSLIPKEVKKQRHLIKSWKKNYAAKRAAESFDQFMSSLSSNAQSELTVKDLGHEG